MANERRPYWADDRTGRQWWEFHLEHPEVFEAYVRFSDEWLRARPGQRCGMAMLRERLRWEHAIGNLGGGDWKLNNNYTPLYARLLMARVERFDGLFELRRRPLERTVVKVLPARG